MDDFQATSVGLSNVTPEHARGISPLLLSLIPCPGRMGVWSWRGIESVSSARFRWRAVGSCERVEFVRLRQGSTGR